MKADGAPTFLEDGAGTRIHYHYNPARNGRQLFVFVNSSDATAATGEDRICLSLREAGYGTLSVDFRG